MSVGEFRRAPKIPLVIVLDNVRSHHNVGSVFRTADAFGAECIHLCGITAVPPHREIHKTALGATESVKWLYFGDPLESVKSLKNGGYRVLAVEQTTGSTPLQELEIRSGEKVAIVLGNEIHGISDAILAECEGSLEIPQFGTKHSLNISVAAGIVAWEIMKKIRR